jgi:hypothetical protein
VRTPKDTSPARDSAYSRASLTCAFQGAPAAADGAASSTIVTHAK